MRVLNILVGGVIAATVWSCNVQKKYETKSVGFETVPSVELDSTKTYVNALTREAFFQDAHLLALINKGLEKNIQIEVAVLSLKQAEQSYLRSRNALVPTISLLGNAANDWQSQRTLNGSLTKEFLGKDYLSDFNLGLQFNWEIDFWKKAALTKGVEQNRMLSEASNVEAIKLRLINDISMAYYQLIAADANRENAQKNVTLTEDLVRVTRLKYESSKVPMTDLTMAETQLQTAKILLTVASENVKIYEAQLNTLCNEYPSPIERSSIESSALNLSTADLEFPVVLLAQRPDVRAAEFQIMSSYASLGLAKANLYPSLSIGARVGFNAQEIAEWFNVPGAIFKNVSLGLLQPLLQQRALKTNMEQAKLSLEMDEKRFKAVVVEAVNDLDLLNNQIVLQQQLLSLLEEKQDKLELNLKHNRLLYDNSKVDYLNVIYAQNEVMNNELEVNKCKVNLNSLMVRFYIGTGGGVK